MIGATIGGGVSLVPQKISSFFPRTVLIIVLGTTPVNNIPITHGFIEEAIDVSFLNY